jgi:vitamin B12 transporter
MRKLYTFIAACVINCSISQAQDSLKTTMLNEVVTTASRYDQPLIETPRSVTVISQELIEKSIYNSIGELLANQSGMYVVGATQTPGTTQALFMRGASSNQVSVMIDGARITDPSTPNSALDLNELSLTDVERIEIIRGSHSTLYGGAAVGGVVNIITKRGGKPGFHGKASIQAGTFGKSSTSLSENIGLTYTLKNGVYLNASLFNQKVKGLNASLDTLGNSTFPKPDNDDFEKTDIYVKAGYKNKRWDGFVSFKKIDQRADIDNGVYDDDDNAILDFERDLIDYQLGYQLTKNWRASVIGSWSRSERLNLNDSSLIDVNGNYNSTFVRNVYDGKLATNELQLNYQSGKLKAVGGAGQFMEEMNFNTYYFNHSSFGDFISEVNYDTLDTSARTNYIFGQMNFALGDFSLSVGTRWNNHSLFGNHWTFEANPSYYFDNTLLYASISTGFNPASIYQLYDPSTSFNAYTTRGNRKLKPEESVSLELGLKKEFLEGSFLTLSVYRTETKNAIEYVYLWDQNTSIENLTFAENRGDTYLNIAKQIVNGIELDGRLNLGKFRVSGNVTWLEGEITVDPTNLNTQETGGHHVQLFNYGAFLTTDKVSIDKLVRRPAFTAYGELRYNPIENVSVSAVYRYTGSRFDSGYDETLGPYGALNQYKVNHYNLVDLNANWAIFKSLDLGVKVENIFNERYQEIIGFQTRKRGAYVMLSYRW